MQNLIQIYFLVQIAEFRNMYKVVPKNLIFLLTYVQLFSNNRNYSRLIVYTIVNIFTKKYFSNAVFKINFFYSMSIVDNFHNNTKKIKF